MTNSNRLTSHFTAHRRFSNKLPRLYLDSRHDPDDPYHLDVYFINNSGHPLEWVELRNPLLEGRRRAREGSPNFRQGYQQVQLQSAGVAT